MSLARTPEDAAEVAVKPRRSGITRRQALVAAAATGVGVGAIRLLGGAVQSLSTVRKHTGTDWAAPLGTPSALVMQLLRRTSFGYTAEELDIALSDGFNNTVDRLIETPSVKPPDLAAAMTPGGRFAPADLQAWWAGHMLTSPTPFAERMTLFLHGHFTSDYRKVADNTFMYWQNLTWRRMAMTNLRSMLMDVTTDPAMLRYLDLATSSAQSPNENYSRELMELFTMGAGNFTEQDVRESAKALAGWTLPQPDSYATVTVDAANKVTRKLSVYNAPKSGVFNQKRAYKGSVTFLGQSGPLDTQGVIDRILANPATANFIAAKVARDFVMSQPSKAYVTRLANTFRSSKYDMKTLMRAVFTSPEFSSSDNYRSLLKSPVEYMVSGLKAVGTTNVTKPVGAAGSGMGQTLFDPPDVGGWPTNESWISSNTVVARVNFVTLLLGQMKNKFPSATDAPKKQLDGVLSPQTATLLNQATDDRARWFITLASPEFQLK